MEGGWAWGEGEGTVRREVGSLASRPSGGCVVVEAAQKNALVADGLVTFPARFLLFDEDNWNVSQAVGVAALDNAIDDGEFAVAEVTHHVISRTPGYKDYDRIHDLQPTAMPVDPTVTVQATDQAGILLSRSHT